MGHKEDRPARGGHQTPFWGRGKSPGLAPTQKADPISWFLSAVDMW
jgi:hypothetical protein